MTKLKLVLIGVILVVVSGTAKAQKSGYISVDNVVALMPDVEKLNPLLQKYQADSLNPQFAYIVQEYNRKDSMVSGKDSAKYTPAIRAQIRQEMESLAYQVQNWQAYVQQATQNKQEEFLTPIYRKVMEAINQVAKENGYTYVYTKEALLVAPTSDDLLPLVAKKLNLKIPTGVTQPGPTTTKPPVKKGN
jgi:outer membrane protein